MKLFIDTEFFKGMNIGFGLDESKHCHDDRPHPLPCLLTGVTSSEEAFTVFNGERTVLCELTPPTRYHGYTDHTLRVQSRMYWQYRSWITPTG